MPIPSFRTPPFLSVSSPDYLVFPSHPFPLSPPHRSLLVTQGETGKPFITKGIQGLPELLNKTLTTFGTSTAATVLPVHDKMFIGPSGFRFHAENLTPGSFLPGSQLAANRAKCGLDHSS